MAGFGVTPEAIPLELVYQLRVEDSWTRVGMRSLDWTGSVEITYDYQPAPAPTPEGSSLSLMLFGLGILFATITRKALSRKVSL